jgi:hypothetical protein
MTQEHPEQPKGELIDELRELVAEWQTMDDMMYDHWAEDVAKAKAYEEAANELQAVIEDYE